MTIYKSKNPEVNREFSESVDAKKLELELKKVSQLKDYDVYNIEERSDGALQIIAYKNEKLNLDVVIVTDEMRKKYPELKNVNMIQKVPYNKDITWDNAMKYAKNLKLAGYSDWRLPDWKEAVGIVKAFGKEKEVKLIWLYWTSTEYSPSGSYACTVLTRTGEDKYRLKSDPCFCFCVR